MLVVQITVYHIIYDGLYRSVARPHSLAFYPASSSRTTGKPRRVPEPRIPEAQDTVHHKVVQDKVVQDTADIVEQELVEQESVEPTAIKAQFVKVFFVWVMQMNSCPKARRDRIASCTGGRKDNNLPARFKSE